MAESHTDEDRTNIYLDGKLVEIGVYGTDGMYGECTIQITEEQLVKVSGMSRELTRRLAPALYCDVELRVKVVRSNTKEEGSR